MLDTECTPVLDVDFSDLHIPRAWGSGLGIAGSLSSFMSYMGSAGLGPDHLQVFRCSKEAEPLRGHAANQSLWTCEGAKLGWGQGQLFGLLGPQPSSHAWTEGQMAWVPCSVGLALAEGTLGQNWPDQTSCLPTLQSAAAAPSPVMGGIAPNDAMAAGPMAPGFFQVQPGLGPCPPDSGCMCVRE